MSIVGRRALESPGPAPWRPGSSWRGPAAIGSPGGEVVVRRRRPGLQHDPVPPGNRRITFAMNNSTSGIGVVSGEDHDGASGHPHVAAGVWDGSTLSVYLDGYTRRLRGVSRSHSPLPTRAPRSGSVPRRPSAGNIYAFQGIIDEVRLSNCARYSGPGYVPASGPFVADAQTLGLWHLDLILTPSESYVHRSHAWARHPRMRGIMLFFLQLLQDSGCGPVQ